MDVSVDGGDRCVAADVSCLYIVLIRCVRGMVVCC